MRIYPCPSDVKAKALLAACDLPTSDLEPTHFEHFFGCGPDDDPKGIVGLEVHGDVGLLRSLVVHPSARGQGCARRLVREAETHAEANGVRALYLLTTTAVAFFGALGYVVVDRRSVPDAIRRTRELSSQCPSHSSVMFKRLNANGTRGRP
jgi:amino-acid N-acetyltransferase